MRITIEPTSGADYPVVSIGVPSDDLDMSAMIDVVRAALLAWGYPEATVNEYLSAS